MNISTSMQLYERFFSFIKITIKVKYNFETTLLYIILWNIKYLLIKIVVKDIIKKWIQKILSLSSVFFVYS